MEDIFIDYIKCAGDWMNSTLVISSRSSSSKELKMEEIYMQYSDLKKKHGNVVAKCIRDEKRALQEQLDAQPEPDPDMLPWVLAHPDLPGSEAAGLMNKTI